MSFWHHIASVDWTSLDSQSRLCCWLCPRSHQCTVTCRVTSTHLWSVVSSFVFYPLSGSLLLLFFFPIRPPCHPSSLSTVFTNVMPLLPDHWHQQAGGLEIHVILNPLTKEKSQKRETCFEYFMLNWKTRGRKKRLKLMIDFQTANSFLSAIPRAVPRLWIKIQHEINCKNALNIN